MSIFDARTVAMIVLAGLLLVPASAGEAETRSVAIEDDYAYPQYGEYDYSVEIVPVETDPGRIRIEVRNLGLAAIHGAWGWASSSGRSCWASWDFLWPRDETTTIRIRAIDDTPVWNPVRYRMELQSPGRPTEVVDFDLPGSPGYDSWKIVTLSDIPVHEGENTLFLGTYQMDFHPDYRVDWVEIGGLRIEAEGYDRMGGNDPDRDKRGVHVAPRNVRVRVWAGDPSDGGIVLYEHVVGGHQEIIDYGHTVPGNTVASRVLEAGDNDGFELDLSRLPLMDGCFEMTVMVDPDDVIREVNEDNNVTHRRICATP